MVDQKVGKIEWIKDPVKDILQATITSSTCIGQCGAVACKLFCRTYCGIMTSGG